jgi:hypothetical protein
LDTRLPNGLSHDAFRIDSKQFRPGRIDIEVAEAAIKPVNDIWRIVNQTPVILKGQ